jgi:hypothetical protein
VNPTEYLNQLKAVTATNPYVVESLIKRERMSKFDAYIRLSLILTDDSRLEAMEFIQSSPEEM